MDAKAVDLDAYWVPFTPNRDFRREPRIMVAADGMHCTTHDGRQVLDAVSGLWCVSLGHNRKPIAEAITRQLSRMDYVTAFQSTNDQAFAAAHAMADLAPEGLDKVMFCNSGSEAADSALKLALAYHRANGQPQRTVFVGREKGYHGVNFGGMSVGGIPGNRKAFGAQLLPRVDHMQFIHEPKNHSHIRNELPEWDFDPLVELEQRILALHDPSNVAAVIVEPVAGSAGWYIPPKGYMQRLRQICDQHGILLIFDEVITGFGRLGTTFGADYFGVTPDIMTFAKTVTNGVIPLGGLVARRAIFDALETGPEHLSEFAHGYTYSGHPVACAAAVAAINLLKDEQLVERAAQMGPLLSDAIHNACTGLPNVIGIRTLGMAAAVELAPRPGAVGKRGYEVFLDCYRSGVLVRPAGDNLVFAPAYIVTPEQIDQMASTLAAAIKRCA
jgi:beta-alanine--pyruvate transaminase